MSFVCAFGIAASWPVRNCPSWTKGASAQPALPDFCYRLTLRVTNSSGATITDRPVVAPSTGGVNLSGYTTVGYLREPELWDILPTTTGGTEIDVMLQDVTSSTARVWMLASGAIANNASSSYYWYMGNDEALRDQAFRMYGADQVTAADSASLDITDELVLEVTAAVPGGAAQNADLADKSAGATGYGLRTIDNAGALEVQGSIDGVTVTSGTWDGAKAVWRLTYSDPDIVLLKDGVSVGTATHAGGIVNTAAALDMGTDLTGVIYGVELQAAGALVSYFGFNPTGLSETSATPPDYAGTVADYTGTNDALYSMTRSMTGITVSIGSVALQFTDPILSINPRFNDVIGGVGDFDPFAAANESATTSDVPFLAATATAISGTGLPAQAGWTMMLSILGIIAAAIVWRTSGNYFLAVIAAGIPLLLGNVLGVLAPAVSILFGIMALGIWASSKFARA